MSDSLPYAWAANRSLYSVLWANDTIETRHHEALIKSAEGVSGGNGAYRLYPLARCGATILQQYQCFQSHSRR